MVWSCILFVWQVRAWLNKVQMAYHKEIHCKGWLVVSRWSTLFPYMRVHYVGNLFLLIGFVLGHPTLSCNHWLKRNGYGRDRVWQIIIGLMWMEWKLPFKDFNDLLLWTPHNVLPTFLLNFLGSRVIEGCNLLTSLWCQNQKTNKLRKYFFKTCELSFYADVGPSYWPANMHEYFLLVYTYPCLIVYFLSWDNWDWFWKWIGNCIKCGNTKQGIKALFARIYLVCAASIWHFRWFGVEVVISR